MSATLNGTPQKYSFIYGTSGGTTVFTVSYTISAGTNTRIVVGVSGRDSANDRSVSSVTWNTSENLSQVSGALKRSSTMHQMADVWHLAAPSTGTHDIVVTMSGGFDKGFEVHVSAWDDCGAPGTPVTNEITTPGTLTANVTNSSGQLTYAVGYGFGAVDATAMVAANTALTRTNWVGSLEASTSEYDTAANPAMSFTDAGAFSLPSIITAVPFSAPASGGSAAASSQGTSTATMGGAAKASGDGYAAVVDSGDATGQSLASGVMNATGTSTAVMVGNALAGGGTSGAIYSAGISVATMAGAETASGGMSAAGASVATMVGFANNTGSGALVSSGTSTATFVGQSLASGAVSAGGTATATMVGAGGVSASPAETPIVQQGGSGGSLGWNPWSEAAKEEQENLDRQHEAIARLMPQVIREVIKRKMGAR
jgi:hypothetical protein